VVCLGHGPECLRRYRAFQMEVQLGLGERGEDLVHMRSGTYQGSGPGVKEMGFDPLPASSRSLAGGWGGAKRVESIQTPAGFVSSIMSVRNIVLLFIAGAALTGCKMMTYGKMSPIVGAGYPGAGSSAAVSISGYTFLPISVAFPGANGVTVTWTNNDPVAHMVTWDSPPSPVSDSVDIAPYGGSFAVSFATATPGTYHYHCSIHPTMTGSIVVN
jgi:plastocyanin